MIDCRWTRRVEQWFDGESSEAAGVEQHIAECARCAAHLEMLRELRQTVAAATLRPGLREAQFPAFLDGIRERLTVETPRRGHRRLWALVSLSAAALVVAFSAFIVFGGKPARVDATVVESCTSEIQGATITTYDSEQGVTTVWITVAGDDVW